MANSVSQYLLKAIGSENALLLERDLEAISQVDQAVDQVKLRACISEAVELVKQRLHSSIATAHRYHNALLPIKKLPSELLSTTIGHAMAETDSHNYQERLIQLSSVSSWWRSVILETPSLWGVIHSFNPDWIVSMALERSKDAPLTVEHQDSSHITRLSGGCTCRHAIGAEDFFGLVSPHMARWRSASLLRLGYGPRSIEWLGQNKIQLPSHLRQLNLCWNQSPSSETPITGFSGLAESLLELTLRNLHVSRDDIICILSTSRRMVSLDLESLLVKEREGEAVQDNDFSDTSPTVIDLPCLKKLHLGYLPPSILGPVVQNINPSNLEKVSINHRLVTEEDPTGSGDPLTSFITRLLETISCVSIRLHSTGVTLTPVSQPACEGDIELQGEHSVVLPWLRLRSLSQITQKHSVKLFISSDGLGDNPEQVVLDNLMRFPKVGSVVLEGRRESWRWVWLLSLSDAVEADSADSRTTTKSWLWPDLEYLSFHGDYVSEFTILSALLLRYGSQPTGRSIGKKDAAPRRLVRLEVEPGGNEWQAEVLDRIRDLVGPGCFKWKTCE